MISDFSSGGVNRALTREVGNGRPGKKAPRAILFPPNRSGLALEDLANRFPEPRSVCQAMVLYEEAQTRLWAKELCDHLAEAPFWEKAQNTWWKIDDLRHPGVLAGAVSKAIRADVLLVAVRSSEGLPLPFYVWVNSWLPHRPPHRGALIGFIGASGDQTSNSNPLCKYLRTLARRAQMSLLLT